MSLNASTFKKMLLSTGLLLVLAQGLWQLPELQNRFFPVDHEKSLLQQAGKECLRIKNDLRTLNERVAYLTWFQAHDGPHQKISADRLRLFPFSESIRPLAPRFFWQTNIRLAHQNRLKVERKLQHLQGLLKNMDQKPPGPPPQAGAALQAQTAALSGSKKKIKQFQDQYDHDNARLMELSKQLATLEDNGFK